MREQQNLKDLGELFKAIKESDNTKVVGLISKNPALSDMRINEYPYRGCTPLFVALSLGNGQIVQYLLTQGTNLLPGSIIESLKNFLNNHFSEDSKSNPTYVNEIRRAITDFNSKKMNLLKFFVKVRKLADKLLVDITETPIPRQITTIMNYALESFGNIQEKCRDNGYTGELYSANPFTDYDEFKKQGQTPISFLACFGASGEFQRKFLDMPKSEQDEQKDRLLKNAIIYGRSANVQFLLDNGANVNSIYEKGKTPFYFAVQLLDKTIASELIKKMNGVEKKGTSLYYMAAGFNNSEAYKLLLENGYNPGTLLTSLVPVIEGKNWVVGLGTFSFGLFNVLGGEKIKYTGADGKEHTKRVPFGIKQIYDYAKNIDLESLKDSKVLLGHLDNIQEIAARRSGYNSETRFSETQKIYKEISRTIENFRAIFLEYQAQHEEKQVLQSYPEIKI